MFSPPPFPSNPYKAQFFLIQQCEPFTHCLRPQEAASSSVPHPSSGSFLNLSTRVCWNCLFSSRVNLFSSINIVSPKQLLIRGYHLHGPCLWNNHPAPFLWPPAGSKSNPNLIAIILWEFDKIWQNINLSFLSICLPSSLFLDVVVPAPCPPAPHI